MSNIKFFSDIAIKESSNEITSKLAMDMQYVSLCCMDCVEILIEDIEWFYGEKITPADYEYLYDLAVSYLDEH